MAIIDNKKATLEDLFSSNILQVPKYQRGYSWTKNELEDFWTDLETIVNSSDYEEHFIGLIVTHADEKNKKVKNIIDGQQRISTSTIILDCIRTQFDYITDTNIRQDANHFISKITSLIGTISSRELLNEPKLILGDKDRDFFKDFIQSTQKISPIKSKLAKSQKNIFEAHKYFSEKFTSLLSNINDEDDKLDLLIKYYKILISDFTFMYIETSEENEAFIIFETLNARGKALDTSDLLKNHIFRQAGHKLNDIQNKWNEIIDTLGNNIDATTFIRHYWNSKNEFTRTQPLYKAIRREIKTTKHAEDLVNDLLELAPIYRSLKHPDVHSDFDDKDINQLLHNLKTLKSTTFYPIILALVSNDSDFNNKDLLNVLKVIEVCIVRNITTAGQNPNTFETFFSKIAYDISHHSFKDSSEIVKTIKEPIISDNEFKELFSNLVVNQDSEKRYLLREIENYYDSEKRIIDDNSIIHIEHIMPQKPQKWDVIKEEAEIYKNRLGNLSLLGEEYNRKASNSIFEDKKPMYKKSKIQISHDLLNYDEWTYSDIENRQKSFSELALEIWPL
ncbi:DUF262 domain-containing protein [Macrococcoides caseolyticum]|nr:DUF262 domain-containing protein [Macrococcus caseolyticus]RKO15996.1 DUF262 domain-containing protein [Macrococcus caseolyticus]